MLKTSFAGLDIPKALTFLLLVTGQYVFCFIMLPPYLDGHTRAAVFAGLFGVLAGYYLFEAEIRRGLEVVIATVRERPALVVTPLRLGLLVAVGAAALYGLFQLLRSVEITLFVRYRWLFLTLYLIDAGVIFAAIAGEPGTKALLQDSMRGAFARANQLVRAAPVELWIVSTFFSFAVKILLAAAIVVGFTGTVQMLLYVMLPWLLLALVLTVVWQGSFGASGRYWAWLLTAPPKAVVRNLFDMQTDALTCPHCDYTIPLVGSYECSGCHFKYKGHYFAWCPWCFQRYGYINCGNEQCGLSRKRPFLY